jgi:hypothetical protein
MDFKAITNEVIASKMLEGEYGKRPIDVFLNNFNRLQQEHLSLIRFISDEVYTIRAVSAERCIELVKSEGIDGLIKMILTRLSEQHYEEAVRLKQLKENVAGFATRIEQLEKILKTTEVKDSHAQPDSGKTD